MNGIVTPPLAPAIWQKRGERYSAGEAIETIFAYKDNSDKNFDCGYDLGIFSDSENEGG